MKFGSVSLKLIKILSRSSLLGSLVGNGSWSVLGAGGGRILNLLAMILLARELGLREFGYFGILQASIGVLGVFAGVSLGSTATRYVAELRGVDNDRAGQIIGMILSLAFGLVFVVIAALLFFAAPIAELLEGSDPFDLRGAVPAAGLLLAANSLRNLQDAIFAGLERFRDASLLKLLDGAAVLAILPLVAARYGIEGALLSMAAGSSIALSVGAILLRRRLVAEGIRIGWSGLGSERGVLVSFSLPTLISNLMGTPALWFGIWYLGQQPGGISQAALYSAAYQWHGPLIFVPLVLNSVGMPRLVRLWTSCDYFQFLKLLVGLAAAAVGLAAIPGVLVALLREQIMTGYGQSFAPGQTVLLLLIAAAPMHVLSNLGSMALQCMNRVWLELASSLAWSASFLLICWILIPSYGAIGLASALFFAYAILAFTRVVLVFLLTAAQRSDTFFSNRKI